MKHKRAPRGKRLFSALLIGSWICFMAIAGFFIPSFLLQLPIFEIRKVTVEGNGKVEFTLIKETIEELSAELFTLSEDELLSLLKVRTDDRVKEVYLSKDFGLKGVTLRVRVVEREPVARVVLGESQLLIDAEGVLFKPFRGEGVSDLPLIRTYDIDLLREYFPRFHRLVLSLGLPVREVSVKRDRVVLRMHRKVVLLPPLELLPEGISRRIKMIYNLPEEKVDLRYDRFILVRN